VASSDPRVPGPDGPAVGAFHARTRHPYRPRWWLHITLFVATLASTTFIGAAFWGALPPEMARLGLLELVTDPRFVLAGLQFSVPLITILLCHEMGHYLAARRHGLVATPPFFIPFPVPLFGIGTLGAVIRIKEPIRNKQQLLDVGAAGPIAGFVALLPFLVYGVLASETVAGDMEGAFLMFGEPLVWELVEWLAYPNLGDDVTLLLHPVGVAAWFGILVTLLNLLPFSQLDGGHVTYALFGRWHRRAAWPLLGVLAVLGFWWAGWWLWCVIAVVLNPRHPRIWDEDLPLDPRRRWVGWIALAIFVLCFMPAPLELVF